MKKIVSLTLCLILAFSMAGCDRLQAIKDELPPPPSSAGDEPESPQPAAEAPVEKPVIEAVPVENPIIIKHEKTEIKDYDPAESKQLILTFSYDTPRVYIEGRDEVSSKINEFIGLLNEEYYSGAAHSETDIYAPLGYDLMLQEATDNFTYYYENNAEGVSLEYSADQTSSVVRGDKNVLSIVFHQSSYMGGPHGSYADYSYVFDTETGEKLSLENLSSDSEVLRSFLVDKMVSLAEADAEEYYSQRIVFVTNEQMPEAFGNLLRDGSWYFDDEGMVIFSLTEELGPYAAGMVEFRIPYAELQGKIDEKYIPDSRSADGEFEIISIADAEAESVEIIDRLSVSDDGQELCLHALGNVYDVSLTSVSYAERFYELEQLWYCSEMGGTALQLHTVIPEGVPDLMLKYNDAQGEEHRYLISQSGMDGSFMLISDDIETVG